MIANLGSVIAQYASTFTKIKYTTFNSNGITYNDVHATSSIKGMMQPISSEDLILITNLGYSIKGKVSFYASGSEDLLTEEDIIIDSLGNEWVVLPVNETGLLDWREHGNYVKYILGRKVLES